jgi:hypothetical protein
MEPLRKLLSILLLTVFGLPFASPMVALGQSAGNGVRACCRRAGAHHCNEDMGAMNDTASHPLGHQWTSPADKCPFAPQATPAVHLQIAGPSTSAEIYASLVSHPCGLAQTQSKWRIARDRSRSKRGPPSAALA